MAVTPPRVELLAWSECPSHTRALDLLTSALRELGHDDVPVTVTWVESDEEAEREHFVGSPTFRVKGRDVFPPGADEPRALACRIYRLPDGRISPLPDHAQLSTRLAAELGTGR